jgi:hypothetical protein
VTKRKPAKVIIHTVTWTHPITGKPRSLELTDTRDCLHAGNDHLEIRSIKPRDAPHPLSATGYLSHFIDADEAERHHPSPRKPAVRRSLPRSPR